MREVLSKSSLGRGRMALVRKDKEHAGQLLCPACSFFSSRELVLTAS